MENSSSMNLDGRDYSTVWIQFAKHFPGTTITCWIPLYWTICSLSDSTLFGLVPCGQELNLRSDWGSTIGTITFLSAAQMWDGSFEELNMSFQQSLLQEGMYNQTYIDILLNITRNLADRGIYVMLDMHQVSYIQPWQGRPDKTTNNTFLWSRKAFCQGHRWRWRAAFCVAITPQVQFSDRTAWRASTTLTMEFHSGSLRSIQNQNTSGLGLWRKSLSGRRITWLRQLAKAFRSSLGSCPSLGNSDENPEIGFLCFDRWGVSNLFLHEPQQSDSVFVLWSHILRIFLALISVFVRKLRWYFATVGRLLGRNSEKF